MGYGPLVRATTGVTRLWRSPDGADDEFFDATTIFPDHVVARVTALATLAALIRRARTGSAAHVHISQAEVAMNQLADAYAAEAAGFAGLAVEADAAVHAVCPCAGDDEWCVISVRDDADRTVLSGILGAEIPAQRHALITALSAFTAVRDKAQVAALDGNWNSQQAKAAYVDAQGAFDRIFTQSRDSLTALEQGVSNASRVMQDTDAAIGTGFRGLV